jgi:hypothetical protein
VCELTVGQTERFGGSVQGVHRAARSLQSVSSQAEQASVALCLDHVVCGEAEAVQVLDQAGTLAGIGDSCGFQRLEIDHPPESASADASH